MLITNEYLDSYLNAFTHSERELIQAEYITLMDGMPLHKRKEVDKIELMLHTRRKLKGVVA